VILIGYDWTWAANHGLETCDPAQVHQEAADKVDQELKSFVLSRLAQQQNNRAAKARHQPYVAIAGVL
jgi:hypothetical protein